MYQGAVKDDPLKRWPIKPLYLLPEQTTGGIMVDFT
jgi:hypothetical protein